MAARRLDFTHQSSNRQSTIINYLGGFPESAGERLVYAGGYGSRERKPARLVPGRWPPRSGPDQRGARPRAGSRNHSARHLSRREREFLRRRFAPRLMTPHPAPLPEGEGVLAAALCAAADLRTFLHPTTY